MHTLLRRGETRRRAERSKSPQDFSGGFVSGWMAGGCARSSSREKENPPCGGFRDGAQSGGRTHTPLREQDFESSASANSAIRAFCGAKQSNAPGEVHRKFRGGGVRARLSGLNFVPRGKAPALPRSHRRAVAHIGKPWRPAAAASPPRRATRNAAAVPLHTARIPRRLRIPRSRPVRRTPPTRSSGAPLFSAPLYAPAPPDPPPHGFLLEQRK